MCGRYVLCGPVSRLSRHFDLKACPDFAARYNIPPQSQVLVIRQNPELGRVGQLVRWGLIPNWAKDPSIGAKLSNARAEGIAAKPSFRTSFARHRCLIPADGFYEWRLVSENGKLRKQPYYFRPVAEDGVFALAGLLARWKSPAGEDIVSTCVITTAANAVVAPIHDRMPVILGPGDFDGWLDPHNHEVEALIRMLAPTEAASMTAYPVSPAVNRATIEGAQLIEPQDTGEASS